MESIINYDGPAAQLMRAGYTILPSTISSFLPSKVREDFDRFIGLEDGLKKSFRTENVEGVLDAGYSRVENVAASYESFIFRPRIQYYLRESFGGDIPEAAAPLLSSMHQLFIESQQLLFDVVKNPLLRTHAPKLGMLLQNVHLYKDQLEIRRYFGEDRPPLPHIDPGAFSLRLFDTCPDMQIGKPEWPHKNYGLFRKMSHEYRTVAVHESLRQVALPQENAMFLFSGMELQYASGHQIPAVWHYSIPRETDLRDCRRISIFYQLFLENGESGAVEDRVL